MKKIKEEPMSKPIIIVGFPIISQLVRGNSVELEDVILLPDDQLFNESRKAFLNYEIENLLFG